MPQKFLMMMREAAEHRVADIGTAEMIFPARLAVDGDEEKGTITHPLRDGVRKTFANGAVHGRKNKSRMDLVEPKVGSAVLSAPG